MKTAVIGEDADGSTIYNPSLVALLDHYGSAPRACKACRAKTKGKVERPFRFIRQDFFLDRSFRSLDDPDAQFATWLREVSNPRVHATTGRIVDDAFAEEQGSLIALPAHPYDPVLTVERRAGRDGMVSVGGNLYSVPDSARKRVLEVQRHPAEVRIFEDRRLIAQHPVLEGRNRRRVDPSHRTSPRRRRSPPMTELLDRISAALVGLKMPRALEALDHTMQRLEKGELTALEAIDALLSEEYALRETRRIDVALRTAKLIPVKTIESFDFAFQPSLDRERIAALAQFDFIRRRETVHFLGPPGTGKSHLATALGVAAVKAGKSVYRTTLAELTESLVTAERQGRLAEKIRFLARAALPVVDEIGYLPITQGGASLFFQIANARYEKGAMILTSNRGFAEWGDIFGDPVVATALLDRLLHHAVVVRIEGASYRLRKHADLIPEHVRASAPIMPPPKKRGRNKKEMRSDD